MGSQPRRRRSAKESWYQRFSNRKAEWEPLFTQETRRWAQLFAKKHCDGGEFEEAIAQTAFLKKWRHRLRVSLQKGNVAAILACIRCRKPRGSPEALYQVLVT